MKNSSAKMLRRARIASQLVFFAAFVLMLLTLGNAHFETVQKAVFSTDPFLALYSGSFTALALVALVPLALTLVLGRFFCGWVCPLGAIHHAVSSLRARWKRPADAKNLHKRAFSVKYLILILTVVTALAGFELLSVLDPYSLLTRSFAAFVFPAIDNGLDSSAHNTSAEAEPQPEPERRAHVQGTVIGLVFLALLALNLHTRRFFCNVICPLGALYALISRFSLLRITPATSCDQCGACARSCNAAWGIGQKPSPNDCILCFNCAATCPSTNIEISFSLPRIPLTREAPLAPDLSRRHALGSVLTGLCLAALPTVPARAIRKKRDFLRPPGAIEENDFINQCIRCGACVQACPTQFIQPAGFEAGVERLWTPVADASMGYCAYECTRCLHVCPTKAIEKLTAEHKKEFKIGTALVDKNRCYTYSDGIDCSVCEKHCPVEGKAIRFREAETFNYVGDRVVVKQVYVDPDSCTGCGVCQYVCPRKDRPGIFITSDEEQRSSDY